MDKEICNKEWMKYWDNVNIELYALVKQVKKNDNKKRIRNKICKG